MLLVATSRLFQDEKLHSRQTLKYSIPLLLYQAFSASSTIFQTSISSRIVRPMFAPSAASIADFEKLLGNPGLRGGPWGRWAHRLRGRIVIDGCLF